MSVGLTKVLPKWQQASIIKPAAGELATASSTPHFIKNLSLGVNTMNAWIHHLLHSHTTYWDWIGPFLYCSFISLIGKLVSNRSFMIVRILSAPVIIVGCAASYILVSQGISYGLQNADHSVLLGLGTILSYFLLPIITAFFVGGAILISGDLYFDREDQVVILREESLTCWVTGMFGVDIDGTSFCTMSWLTTSCLVLGAICSCFIILVFPIIWVVCAGILVTPLKLIAYEAEIAQYTVGPYKFPVVPLALVVILYGYSFGNYVVANTFTGLYLCYWFSLYLHSYRNNCDQLPILPAAAKHVIVKGIGAIEEIKDKFCPSINVR